MSDLTYSLLKGRAQSAKPFSQSPRQRPHYHILIAVDGDQYDVAVNIASDDPNVDNVRVLYAVKDDITPPSAGALLSLSESIQDLPPGSSLRLDYVADGLVSREEMAPLALYDPLDPSGLSGAIMQTVGRAVGSADATVYVFGHRYTRRRPSNATWGFSPDDGVHNIHMNQGNAPGSHGGENGRHEDGALLIHFAAADTWSAVYVAFQTQSWDNNDHGYPRA